MKIAGIIMLCLGGLMILSGINLGLTKYDLSNSHDLSKFLGGLSVSSLIAIVGLAFLLAGRKKEKKK
jgi:hypothetical protein